MGPHWAAAQREADAFNAAADVEVEAAFEAALEMALPCSDDEAAVEAAPEEALTQSSGDSDNDDRLYYWQEPDPAEPSEAEPAEEPVHTSYYGRQNLLWTAAT